MRREQALADPRHPDNLRTVDADEALRTLTRLLLQDPAPISDVQMRRMEWWLDNKAPKPQ